MNRVNTNRWVGGRGQTTYLSKTCRCGKPIGEGERVCYYCQRDEFEARRGFIGPYQLLAAQNAAALQDPRTPEEKALDDSAFRLAAAIVAAKQQEMDAEFERLSREWQETIKSVRPGL